MSQRIVFEFYYRNDHDLANWNQVTKLLNDFGGSLLSEPAKSPRMLVRASLPTEQRAQEVVKRLRGMDSVGRVSVDALHYAF